MREHGSEIVMVRIKDIKLLNNPKVHPDEQVEDMMASIEKFGFTDPCLISKVDNTLLAGYCRLKAAELLGWDSLPCRITDLSPEEYMVYILSEGRIAEKGTWDYEMIIAWWEDSPQAQRDMVVAWSQEEISDRASWLEEIGSPVNLEEPQVVEEEPAKPAYAEVVLTIPVSLWKKRGDDVEADLIAFCRKYRGAKYSQIKVKA